MVTATFPQLIQRINHLHIGSSSSVDSTDSIKNPNMT